MRNRKGMRIVLMVVAAVAVMAVLGVRAPFAQAQKGPRIELKEERYDFGTIRQGQDAVHVFEFRNAGDEDLVIQKVQTS